MLKIKKYGENLKDLKKKEKYHTFIFNKLKIKIIIIKKMNWTTPFLQTVIQTTLYLTVLHHK